MDFINKNFKKCNIFNIKSKYLIKEIFNKLNPVKTFRIIKYNKNITNKLDINIEDFLGIEIELIPKKYLYTQFIQKNVNDVHI